VEGTPLNAETFNKGNWRDDKSLEFAALEQTDQAPPAITAATQLYTDASGETWLVPPADSGKASFAITPGIPGPKPAHYWDGTSLTMEQPDGTWDSPVDLVGPQGQPGANGTAGTDMGSVTIPIDLGDWDECDGGYEVIIEASEHNMGESSAILAFTKIFSDIDGDTVMTYHRPRISADGDITIKSAAPWQGICVVAGGVAQDGAHVVSIDKTGTDQNGGNIYEITFSDNTTQNFTAAKGDKGNKGDDGAGIVVVGGTTPYNVVFDSDPQTQLDATKTVLDEIADYPVKSGKWVRDYENPPQGQTAKFTMTYSYIGDDPADKAVDLDSVGNTELEKVMFAMMFGIPEKIADTYHDFDNPWSVDLTDMGNFDAYIQAMKECGVRSIVVDMDGDFGWGIVNDTVLRLDNIVISQTANFRSEIKGILTRPSQWINGLENVNTVTQEITIENSLELGNAVRLHALPVVKEAPKDGAFYGRKNGHWTSAVPVSSVNGKTGAVNLTASDVGAMSSATGIRDYVGWNWFLVPQTTYALVQSDGAAAVWDVNLATWWNNSTNLPANTLKRVTIMNIGAPFYLTQSSSGQPPFFVGWQRPMRYFDGFIRKDGSSNGYQVFGLFIDW